MSKYGSPQYAIRLDTYIASVVEAHRVRLERERPGEKVTTSDAIRSLIMRGADPADMKRTKKSA